MAIIKSANGIEIRLGGIPTLAKETEGKDIMRISFFFALYDFWIGAFYDQKKHILYICPLPCCVFKIELMRI